MASALWRVTSASGKERGQETGAHVRNLVEMEMAGHATRERALRHHGQHAGTGGGFEHGIAGTDGGGLERRIGERKRRRELLEADLLLGAFRVRGLERGDRRQHREHLAGAVGAGAGAIAHGASVALEEQHRRRLGGFIGVLPDPRSLRIARPEGAGHGVTKGCRVERPAGFEHREQGPGRGGERARAGARLRGAGDCGGTGGKLRARGYGRRRGGVEHGVLRIGMSGTAGGVARGIYSRASRPDLSAPRRPASRRRGPGTCGIRRGGCGRVRPRGRGRRR